VAPQDSEKKEKAIKVAGLRLLKIEVSESKGAPTGKEEPKQEKEGLQGVWAAEREGTKGS